MSSPKDDPAASSSTSANDIDRRVPAVTPANSNSRAQTPISRQDQAALNAHSEHAVLLELAAMRERLQALEQLKELPMMREQLQALVRHLRDSKRRARQRVRTIHMRTRSVANAVAEHSPSELELARVRKLLMRPTRARKR